MTASISLALVFHNHQPVGNFGWVFQEVYEKSYAPMIGALEGHPGIRVGIHYTGPLLEWLENEQPEAIERLRALVARGQVEILGGGLYEPILVSLPQRDRYDQLSRMRDEVERLFGVAPAGAWLAERVWEPSLPFDLASAGYRYTVLDDNHLRGAAIPDERMWGTYTTDDQGRMLTIFGTEKGLRYRIPWHPVEDLIDYLRAAATEDGSRVGIMGDDGEKFGGWPGTYELCWGREQWIDKCFTALEENSSWLSTVTPSGWMAEHPPIDRIYVPTASYVEMTEWALPPDQALVFHELGAAIEAAKQPPKWAPFLRGGLWRNFQARYREINDLHKQMLLTSFAVAQMPDGPDKQRALDHLHRGQSNDCYWHGLFGGIYIVHMRMATLHHLIAAQDLAELSGVGAAHGVGDMDLDGRDEVVLSAAGQWLAVDPADGGGIGRWDLRATRVALASVLRRRPEAYHAKLKAAEAAGSLTPGTGAEPINPHESVHVKESSLSKYLVYDEYERRSALVRLRGGDGQHVGEFVSGEWALADGGETSVELTRSAGGVGVRKVIDLGGDRMAPELSVRVDVTAERGFEGVIELEWNVNLSGGGANPDAYYRWDGGETRHDAAGSVPAGTALSFGNTYEGVAILATAEPPADTTWEPIETVSNSEAGFERTYQGSCLTYRWPLTLVAGEQASFEVVLRVTQNRDRAADEAASE